MALFATASRTIVIKASRETLGLVLVASAITFALAYTIHSRPAPAPVASVQREWTGELAGVATDTAGAPEPFKSADLVVPSAQLALPTVPARQTFRRPCDDAGCARVPLPPPSRRQVARSEAPSRIEQKTDQGLLTTLNPLNHVPSLSTMGKPFTYAGDVVSGWIKRF